jgi:hypothetical protein
MEKVLQGSINSVLQDFAEDMKPKQYSGREVDRVNMETVS